MSHGPADDVGLRKITEWRRLIDDTLKFCANYRDQGGPPAHGSELEAELRNSEVGATGPWGSVPVEQAYFLADISLFAAANQLGSIATLLKDEMALFGVETLARASLEGVAQAWWLLEPAVGARERVGRGLAARLASSHEALSLRQRLGAASSGQDDRAEILGTAEDLGFQLDSEKDRWLGRRWTLHELPHPSRTRAVGDLLQAIGVENGTAIYSWLCGIAHSTAFVLMEFFSFDAHEERPETLTAVPQQTLGNLSLALLLSVQAYLAGVKRVAGLNGWDVAMLDSWRRSRVATAFVDSTDDQGIG